MSEYNKMARGYYSVTGSAPPNGKMINIPFKPQAVKLYNYTSAATPAQNGVPFAFWDASMGQGYAMMQAFNATPVLTTDVVTSNGISTFAAGELLQYGPNLQVASITKASPAVVTTGSAHGLASGDVVVFQGLYQSSTTGMPQITTIPFTVTVTGATTFTIPWNTNQSEYTAISGSPSGAIVKKVLYPYLYEPGVCEVSAITTGTTTTIDTASAHNFVVGQQVAFRIPDSWGTTQLNSLPNATVPGSPKYAYVIAVTDYNTFVIDVDSSAYTAFDSNQPFANVSGQQFAQVVAVGDVNTGGPVISSGSPLYPSQSITPIGTTQVRSIGSPGINGAYFNNTSQGFIVGPGAGATLTSAYLGGTSGDVIYWEAFYYDFS